MKINPKDKPDAAHYGSIRPQSLIINPEEVFLFSETFMQVSTSTSLLGAMELVVKAADLIHPLVLFLHGFSFSRVFFTYLRFLCVLVSDEETGLEIHQVSRPPGFSVERRRSRAVLYQLSGHLQKQDKTKSKLKINNVRHVCSDPKSLL